MGTKQANRDRVRSDWLSGQCRQGLDMVCNKLGTMYYTTLVFVSTSIEYTTGTGIGPELFKEPVIRVIA